MIPLWHRLAARTSIVLRQVVAETKTFPEDMTGACQCATVLLAMVWKEHRIKGVIAQKKMPERGIGHTWNEIDGRIVDLTATQLGFPEIVHVPSERGIYRNPERANLHRAMRVMRVLDRSYVHACYPRCHYKVLVPSLSQILGIPRGEAKSKLRAVIGPEVRS